MKRRTWKEKCPVCDLSRNDEANKWGCRNSCIEMEKGTDGKQSTHLLLYVSTVTTWHSSQTHKSSEIMREKKSVSPHNSLWPTDSAHCSTVILIKQGHHPFQFSQCGSVLLEAINWLNSGTISQYAGADEPTRGETWCPRREKRMQASISLTHGLTFIHGRHTQTQWYTQNDTYSSERAGKRKVRRERNRSGGKMGPVTIFTCF